MLNMIGLQINVNNTKAIVFTLVLLWGINRKKFTIEVWLGKALPIGDEKRGQIIFGLCGTGLERGSIPSHLQCVHGK